MRTILNLTQHEATAEQKAMGVIEPRDKAEVIKLITFCSIKDTEARSMLERANRLADIAEEHGVDTVMVGGAPFFASTLEMVLNRRCIVPVYAFSVRKSVDRHNEDGTVTKTMTFKHEGFVVGAC